MERLGYWAPATCICTTHSARVQQLPGRFEQAADPRVLFGQPAGVSEEGEDPWAEADPPNSLSSSDFVVMIMSVARVPARSRGEFPSSTS